MEHYDEAMVISSMVCDDCYEEIHDCGDCGKVFDYGQKIYCTGNTHVCKKCTKIDDKKKAVSK